ncbi:ribonucleoside hydrolase RihC [Streptobacillus canis]|uniref:ribonucleoside hydrolase RihC n=1 Tax=Streptobacillus canis TaxID=2678686 RepID=UPI001E40490B|nr:ribonucleoside hydrolase RihC [Streptobacillus canis]
MRKNLIIDTDPGIDDAVAIAIALFSEKYNVNLISTVAGNVDIEKVTLNARRLLKFFGKEEIPVVMGSKSPLIEKLETAVDVHGLSGMEGWDFEDPVVDIVDENFLSYMYKTIMEKDKKTTIMAIGPLTNIALLLKIYPDVKNKIEEIVFMGGSLTRGNKGVMSEFNIAVDPEAAYIVIHSGVPIVMAGLDIGLKALIYPEDSEKIKVQNKTGEMVYSLFKKYRGGSFNTGLKMYDSTAVAYLLKPDLFEYVDTYVDVELKGEMTKGVTLVDLRGYLKKDIKNVKVITDVKAEEFRTWFIESLNKCI